MFERRRPWLYHPWVHQIAGDHGPDDAVPPEDIVGAWMVDEEGRLIGSSFPTIDARLIDVRA